jgi:predicted metal-dependent phosphoesterase TrpH
MKLDLHNHSMYSPDAITTPEHMLWLAKQQNVGLAITDHHSIKSWPRFKEANKKYQVPLIYGEEIKIYNSRKKCVGELIALFVQEVVQPGFMHDVIDSLQAQDAIISIAHPFDPFRKNCKVLDEIIQRVDCIEAFNSRVWFQGPNKKAQRLIKEKKKAFTAGSDAHIPFEFSHAHIEVKATELEDARKEIKKGALGFSGILTNPVAHFYTQMAKRNLIKDTWTDSND